MYPDKKIAMYELEIAGKMNPGLWPEHCMYVASAAENIAKHCEDMNSEKAYVLGLLHDIGRRNGIYAVRHMIEGYDFCMSKGWDEAAERFGKLMKI